MEGLRDLAHHQVELRFAGPVPDTAFSTLAGVSDVQVDDHVLRLRVSGPITPLAAATCLEHEPLDFVSREPSLKK